jgi:hypothetical protein
VACAFNPAGDTDTFKVTVPADSDLSINIAGPSWTYWKIFAPNGSPINPDGCYGQCEVALYTAGMYTIETSNLYNFTGAYQLSLLGVSTPFRCGPSVIPGGSPISGQFNLAGDTDSYQLNGVSADQTYSINVAGPSWTYWKIFPPTPHSPAINPEGCYGQCQVTLPNGGGYTITVSNLYNFTGSYTLSVQRVSGQ